MAFLLDTNLLVRLSDPLSPLQPVAQQAIERLLQRGEILYLTTQNLIEFWAVATRPMEANGLDWNLVEAQSRIESLARQFAILDDNAEIRPHWIDLVTTCGIRGKKVHDARLVAVMKAHGVTHLLTFNVEDFKLFTFIIVLHPNDILATAS